MQHLTAAQLARAAVAVLFVWLALSWRFRNTHSNRSPRVARLELLVLIALLLFIVVAGGGYYALVLTRQ